MIDTAHIKNQFPIFKHLPGLVYLDSTATSLKPASVIAKEMEYYERYSANIFRGVYKISEEATKEYEETRTETAAFIHARPEEVIFTRNTTEAINLVAYALGRGLVDEESEVVTTLMEHHSNFVPWQQLAFENGAAFKVMHVSADGHLTGDLHDIISRKTKILALTYVSNVLGTINPVAEIAKTARAINPEIIIVVDAAQAAPHMLLNVSALGADFMAFSAHKMLGPTGVGVLWGRKEILDRMYPFLYGGEMIDEVAIEKTTFKETPHKFEAGTPDIAGVVAFKEAIRFLKSVGMEAVREHEESLTRYAIDTLRREFPELTVIGPADVKDRGGIVTFTFGDYHPHDVAQILDESDVAVRAGHHCAMPLHRGMNMSATTRASFYIYNDEKDVEKLVEGLKNVKKILKK